MEQIRLIFCLVWLVIAAVTGALTPLSAARAEEDALLVFAASSLAPPLEKIAAMYRDRAGVMLRLSFASSAVLARQIEFGAPADLFISAHPRWVARLAERGDIELDTARAIAGNRLVIARHESQEGHSARDFRALLLAPRAGRIATGDPDSVPLGIYARDSLVALNLWDQVGPRLAPAANATAALMQVARGLAPLGILYASDAARSPFVEIAAELPAASYGPIRYLAAPVRRGPRRQAALEFAAFLDGPEAAEVFAGYGFTAPD